MKYGERKWTVSDSIGSASDEEAAESPLSGCAAANGKRGPVSRSLSGEWPSDLHFDDARRVERFYCAKLCAPAPSLESTMNWGYCADSSGW